MKLLFSSFLILFIFYSFSTEASCLRQSRNKDYCGPENNQKLARLIPDKLFGPFRSACSRHDYCYYDGANKVIRKMERHYRMSLNSVNKKMKKEFKREINRLRKNCDKQLSNNLGQACTRVNFARKNTCKNTWCN